MTTHAPDATGRHRKTDTAPEPDLAAATAAIARGIWRQETADAITRRLTAIADEVALTHAAMVPVLGLDREALTPVYASLSDARTAIETALHGLDRWAGQ